MFRRIIVAEDFESASISVKKSLKDLKIEDAKFVSYCDEAFTLIKENLANNPFDLLITDLSFEEDHIPQNLKSGQDLIREVRKIAPELKILVFSGEKRAQIQRELFDDFHINGFVSKGRLDAQNLINTIINLEKKDKFLSRENLISIRKTSTIELTTLEFSILELLSNGISQKNMPEVLKEKNLKPNSLSSVEKTLNFLKETFEAKSNEHLIALTKDLGIL